jgi:hypothetical protein
LAAAVASSLPAASTMEPAPEASEESEVSGRSSTVPSASSHSAGGSDSPVMVVTSATSAGGASTPGTSPFPLDSSIADAGTTGASLARVVGDPVVSRIWSMMSDFLVRTLAFRPSALAIAKSWSLSLDSRTDCSSASAATDTSLPMGPWGLGPRCGTVSELPARTGNDGPTVT